jgi:hypothetical protein
VSFHAATLVLPWLVVAAAQTPACSGSVTLSGDVGGEWAPAVDAEPGGWRDSATPWMPSSGVDTCARSNWTFFDILPTPHGLYLAWAYTEFDPAPGPSDFLHGFVMLNAGSGWTESFRADCSLEEGTLPACRNCVERILGALGDGILVRDWGGTHRPLGVLFAGRQELLREESWTLSDC